MSGRSIFTELQNKKMTTSVYNDMPKDLREKIHLWDVLNQIFKNGGFVDIAAITTELANLKTQINVLLSDVLGLEHEIDGVHNYDDTSLQTKIDGLDEKLRSLEDDMSSDLLGIISRIVGINNTSSKISLQNLANIEASTMNGDNHGTRILLTPQQIALQSVGEPVLPEGSSILFGQISLGGGATDAGVTIDSDNPIILNNRSGSHHLSVKSDKVEVSDINGLKISFDSTKITFTHPNNSLIATIPWDS